jgi:hypothetical protein
MLNGRFNDGMKYFGAAAAEREAPGCKLPADARKEGPPREHGVNGVLAAGETAH